MCEPIVKIITFTIIYFSLISTIESHSSCTNVYGAEVCSFLPAPPGKTPPCALPGLTYCEHPEHYPGDRIEYLIQKWRFDHSTILTDESKEDFSSYYYPPPTYKYGPGNTIKQDHYYPEPIYIPKPHYNYGESTRVGNTYIPPKPNGAHNFTQGFIGYPNTRPSEAQYLNFKYNNNIPPRTQQGDTHIPYPFGLPHINPYTTKIWYNNKYEKLVRRKRSQPKMPFANNTVSDRKKRQSAITGQPLCETRSQFIMPRAALNNKGNWMYVVNMPEMDNRFTQLVKSETCASQTCNGLCSLPLGYTSRCEQKYVQKRLIALEGAGNDLYNDVFWFPSCCVCTISNS